MKYNWSKDAISGAISNSSNYCEVLRFLNIPLAGRNTETLKRKISEYDIDISHFNGRNYKIGEEHNKYVKASEYINNKKKIHSTRLKDKLIREGYLAEKCYCCGIENWNGKKLVFQLHHIDGNHENNSLDNLTLLCPNCHSQTENYGGYSQKKAKYYCPDCGAEISKTAKYCKKCYGLHHSKIKVSDEQLNEDYLMLGSYVAVAKKYGVSEASIRKHIKK